MPRTASRPSASSATPESRTCAKPVMAVSTLLKSCAMPPARRPRASNLVGRVQPLLGLPQHPLRDAAVVGLERQRDEVGDGGREVALLGLPPPRRADVLVAHDADHAALAPDRHVEHRRDPPRHEVCGVEAGGARVVLRVVGGQRPGVGDGREVPRAGVAREDGAGRVGAGRAFVLLDGVDRRALVGEPPRRRRARRRGTRRPPRRCAAARRSAGPARRPRGTRGPRARGRGARPARPSGGGARRRSRRGRGGAPAGAWWPRAGA